MGYECFRTIDSIYPMRLAYEKWQEEQEIERQRQAAGGRNIMTEAQKKILMKQEIFQENPHLLEFAKIR